jgi:uncharacterized membrane protein YphA (DoxX/SURF4 family)
VALLILRISLAAAIVDTGCYGRNSSFAPVILLVSAVQSVLLGLGFLTPIASMAACVFELASLFTAGHSDEHFIVLSCLNAVAITFLGPGAYSCDARLFGRREIVLPSGVRPDRS